MTRCQNCRAETQLYLCDNCQIQLANMLNQLPWIIEELDTRIQKLDRTGVTTNGRNHRPDWLNVIDFDAADTARKLRKKLAHYVTDVATRHTGRPPAALTTVATKDLARWLEHNVDAIARLSYARKNRHTLYDDIHHLVGAPADPRGGQLIRALNTHEQHFAGTCPTTRARHGNETIECGTMLYADIDETTITCPTCHQTIDVEENRKTAAKSRDLATRDDLYDILANIDEAITEPQLDAWINARRLRRRGWLHNGEIVETRINEHSQPVYSVSRAQKLRRRDLELTRRTG